GGTCTRGLVPGGEQLRARLTDLRLTTLDENQSRHRIDRELHHGGWRRPYTGGRVLAHHARPHRSGELSAGRVLDDRTLTVESDPDGCHVRRRVAREERK